MRFCRIKKKQILSYFYLFVSFPRERKTRQYTDNIKKQ